MFSPVMTCPSSCSSWRGGRRTDRHDCCGKARSRTEATRSWGGGTGGRRTSKSEGGGFWRTKLGVDRENSDAFLDSHFFFQACFFILGSCCCFSRLLSCGCGCRCGGGRRRILSSLLPRLRLRLPLLHASTPLLLFLPVILFADYRCGKRRKINLNVMPR